MWKQEQTVSNSIMRIILILLLPFFIGACMQKKPTVSVVKTVDFVLVDTSESAREYLRGEEH